MHGEIERAEIVRDPHTRDSRGFAFVNYSSGDAAQAALKALDGVEIEGRAIIVQMASSFNSGQATASSHSNSRTIPRTRKA